MPRVGKCSSAPTHKDCGGILKSQTKLRKWQSAGGRFMHRERSRFAKRILVLSCRDLATLTHVVQAQEWV